MSMKKLAGMYALMGAAMAFGGFEQPFNITKPNVNLGTGIILEQSKRKPKKPKQFQKKKKMKNPNQYHK